MQGLVLVPLRWREGIQLGFQERRTRQSFDSVQGTSLQIVSTDGAADREREPSGCGPYDCRPRQDRDVQIKSEGCFQQEEANNHK